MNLFRPAVASGVRSRLDDCAHSSTAHRRAIAIGFQALRPAAELLPQSADWRVYENSAGRRFHTKYPTRIPVQVDGQDPLLPTVSILTSARLQPLTSQLRQS